MAANDPVSKCIACQFDIAPGDFNFGPAIPGSPSSPPGYLPPPDAPGLASLVQALIEAFIEAMLYLVSIVEKLISNIPDFIDWVNTLLSDPVQFMINLFELYVLDPFISKLQVDIPAFDLTLKIFGNDVNVPVPASENTSVTGPLAPTMDNPNWTSQIPGFFQLMQGMLTFPFDILMAIIEELVNFTLPPIGQELIERVWDALLPSMGFTPGTEAFEATSKLGMCVIEQLVPLVPPAFPPNGYAPGAAPTVVIDSGPATQLTHDESIVDFQDGTASPKQFQVSKSNSGDHLVEVSISGATSHFVLTAPPLTLTNAAPNGAFFIQLVTNDPSTSHQIQVIVKVTDPANEVTVFKFKAVNHPKSLLELVQEGYAKFGGEWDAEFNIWAIRRRVGQTYSDQFEDVVGLTYYDAGTWFHLVKRGTTKPGVYWVNQYPQGPQVLRPMFHKNIWRKRNHYSQFPSLVAANYSPSQVLEPTVAFVDGSKTCKQRPSDRVVTLRNQVINLHTTAAGANRTGPFPSTIGRWSAGCTVVQKIEEYYEMMDAIFGLYAERYAYSYMLFTDKQVPELNSKVIEEYGI